MPYAKQLLIHQKLCRTSKEICEMRFWLSVHVHCKMFVNKGFRVSDKLSRKSTLAGKAALSFFFPPFSLLLPLLPDCLLKLNCGTLLFCYLNNWKTARSSYHICARTQSKWTICKNRWTWSWCTVRYTKMLTSETASHMLHMLHIYLDCSPSFWGNLFSRSLN